MNERQVPINQDGAPLETAEERALRQIEEAEGFGLEPAHTEDVVLGAEIGGVGGAVAGALAGSALGLPGAITGAVIGGVLGAAGSAAAVAVVDRVDDDDLDSETQFQPSTPEVEDEVIDTTLQEEHSLGEKRQFISPKEMPTHPAQPPAVVDPDLRPKSETIFPDITASEAANRRRKTQ